MKTANVTDAQLHEKFRRTALYQSVHEAMGRTQPGEELQLEPLSSAAIIPTKEELESRWPGHTVAQLEALAKDYKRERQQLLDLDLESIVERVKELAAMEMEID